MTISYYLCNPTGNITALVRTPVAADYRKRIAGLIMKSEPSTEQVGFVRGCNLDMAGGEFCGNATLSAAALCCLENGIDDAEIIMTVSGAKEPVNTHIKKTGTNNYSGDVTMPRPLGITETELDLSGKKITAPLVNFDGISHIILTQPADKTECEKEIVKKCEELGAGCLGIMMIENEKLTPLVYVPSPETLVWESSCASGTTAAGIYLATQNGGSFSGEFTEPGGKLKISVSKGSDAKFTAVLSGNVIISEELKIEI